MSDVKYRRRGTAIVETDQGILSLLAGVKFSYCPEVEPPIINQEPKLQLENYENKQVSGRNVLNFFSGT